jgi:hypothetical protein
MTASHMLVEDQPANDRCVLWCKHCSDRFTFLTPCSLSLAAACFETFFEEHKHCKPKPAEPPTKPVCVDGKAALYSDGPMAKVDS